MEIKYRPRNVLGILLFSAFALALHWNTCTLPLIRDEGEYAYAAWILGQGEYPYTASFMQKPPMVIYTYYAALLVDSHAYWPARMLSMAFLILSCLVLRKIVEKEFSEEAGWTAMFLCIPMVLMPGLDQFTANTEKFVLLPILILLYLHLHDGKSSRWYHWFCGGILGAIIFFYKYSLAPIVCLIYAIWVIRASKTRNRISVRNLCTLCGGFVSTSALILLPFILHDGGSAIYDCTIRFNSNYVMTHQMHMSALSHMLILFISKWPLLAFFSLLSILPIVRRHILYVGLLICALLCSFGSWYGHYYIPMMPFWAILISAGIDQSSRYLAQGTGRRKYAWVFLTVLAVLSAVWPSHSQLMMPPEEIAREKTLGQPFAEAVVIGNKVNSMSESRDLVLVAGSEPQILFYAKRHSATRYVIFYPLTLPTPLAAGYQREAVEEIQKNAPKIIVFVTSPSSWLINEGTPQIILPYLNEVLRGEQYFLLGGTMNKDNDVKWQNHLQKNDLKDAGILLFLRKESRS